jgi:broad specificity phosphatase PhoE
MKAYIIRHAEKEIGGHYNNYLRHQDEPITPKGRATAEKLVEHFAGKPIKAIYVSGYRRTGETIDPLAEGLDLDPIVDERLNEIDNGLIEGLSDTQIQERYPDVWQAFIRRSADFRFPEGEMGEEARQRVASFLNDKRREHPNEEIIIVAHDGLIRLLTCHILGLPVYARWKFQVDFCGITEISSLSDGDGWKLIRFNQSCL